jgi:hypothetical protein
MLLDELYKIEAVALDLWQLYRVGKTDLIVASLATNIAIDFVRQAEAEFEDTVVRPKKYSAAKFHVWTLPVVVYNCQMKEFGDNPREEVLKLSLENMDHIMGYINVKVSRSIGRPLWYGRHVLHVCLLGHRHPLELSNARANDEPESQWHCDPTSQRQCDEASFPLAR